MNTSVTLDPLGLAPCCYDWDPKSQRWKDPKTGQYVSIQDVLENLLDNGQMDYNDITDWANKAKVERYPITLDQVALQSY